MVLDIVTGIFRDLEQSIPEQYSILLPLFLYTLFIVIYAVFIWKFYRFLASREVIQLNLKQYNRSSHPSIEKFFAILLYTLEYLVVLPFLVLFWFAVLSLFLLVLSESQSVQQILLIAAAIIVSTRITAYISEDLSRDLAKILPFTILAIFILNPDFFNFGTLLGRIIEIPTLFDHIIMFLIFIFIIEFVLRCFYSIIELIYSDDQSEEETNRT